MPGVKGRERAAGADVLARWVQEGVEPGVAPSPLERVRALLNTDDRFHGEDRLAGGPERLVVLRDALRAHLRGEGHAGLDAVAAELPLVVLLGGPDGTRLVPAPGSDPVAAAAASVLAVVHRAAGDGSWDRLKECGNPACRWVYHDTSRNRSGRWCSMVGCGDLMKARAYRDRRRSPAAG